MANAILEHDRAKNLFDKGALPRQRLDGAQTLHRSAWPSAIWPQPTWPRPRRRCGAREVQRNATITSPVTGYVVERNYDAGAIPGDLPVVVVADMRQMELESAWTALESSAEVVVTQEKALDLARESVSIAQVSYENGVLTSSELNDAQVRLVQTEYLLMQAKYSRITAAARAKVRPASRLGVSEVLCDIKQLCELKNDASS